MLHNRLNNDILYNNTNFEFSWSVLKYEVSYGTFFNYFYKNDVMHEIWDIVHKLRLQKKELKSITNIPHQIARYNYVKKFRKNYYH